jgi:hypothetical protein
MRVMDVVSVVREAEGSPAGVKRIGRSECVP